jgi:type IV pilus assembly protein PilX
MSPALRRAQKGVVLFIALIVLVAMSLAGIALMRNVDTGTIIAGNLAFRQTSTHAGDVGIEAARTWLMSSTASSLHHDQTANAYYATWQAGIDLLGTIAGTPDFDWTLDAKDVTTLVPAPTPPPAGYSARFVIHRLCATDGDPAGASCVRASGSATAASGGTKGAAVYGSYAISVPTASLYRITVQIRGPRNTQTYVQAVVF